jgi:glucose 1-dehydrogenase
VTEASTRSVGRRWAAITGGSRGIGFAVAARFIEDGGNVLLAARDKVQLEAAAQGLRSAAQPDQQVNICVADVSTSAGIDDLFAQIEKDITVLSVFVANAGGGALKSFLDLSESDWKTVVDLNLIGPALCCQRAALHMRDHPGDNQSIVVVSSIRATSTMAGRAVYSSTKAAVSQMVRAAASELAPLGIRVNALAPGVTATTLAEQMPDVFNEVAKAVPLGRAARPDEMASAIAYLTGDSGRFITGSSLVVDGGESLS